MRSGLRRVRRSIGSDVDVSGGCVGWGGVCLDHTLCRRVALCSDWCRCDNERVFYLKDRAGVWTVWEGAGVGGGVEEGVMVKKNTSIIFLLGLCL